MFLRKDKGSNFLLNEILSLHENSFTFAGRASLLPAELYFCPQSFTFARSLTLR